MARPREFDHDDVLDRAVELFWAKGYEATSMEDLVNHLGLHRGSIYGAFGSKDDLYRQALDRYASRQHSQLRDSLGGDTPVREAISSLLGTIASREDDRGCFIVNASCERGASNADLRSDIQSSLRETRNQLIDALGVARSTGEIAAELPIEATADLLILLMEGLQALKRVDGCGADPPVAIDLALDRLLG